MIDFANLITGFGIVLTPENLLYSFLGVLVGNVIGVLPGIGPLAAISMLLPLTFGMTPLGGLVMLAGIYYGAQYGGATTAILLNIPGVVTQAVTCLDGYPMARQGRAGVAIFMAMWASFVGACIGILVMMFLSPLMIMTVKVFSSAEYFSMMALGLLAAATLSGGDALKRISMVIVGLLFGVVGADVNTGVQRFTFGYLELYDGIPIVALAVGLFGINEVVMNINKVQGTLQHKAESITMRSMMPTWKEMRITVNPILRGSGIGTFFGILPGTGAAIASFMAYVIEKRVSRTPERFGKGAIEGIAAPEAANNAAAQTAFIPTLTFGIPGDAVMALMLGALMIFNIQPGPRFPVEHPDLFWALIASFWLGNVLLMIMNVPLIGLWVRMLRLPYRLLYPAILFFICIGVYSVNNSFFDVGLAMGFGLLGYVMSLLGLETAPLLLGFVLGPLMEVHLRRAMLLSSGDPMVFLQRPVSAFFIAACVFVLFLSFRSFLRSRQPSRPIEEIE